jgi:hypothetical protein
LQGNSLVNSNFTGNIIPHCWYHYITNSRGQADTNAILILAEVVYWYRKSTKTNKKIYGDSLQISYSNLSAKLNLTEYQIREALKRLEYLHLVKREVRTLNKYGQIFSNVLFIRLNFELVAKITATNKTNIDTDNIEEVINFDEVSSKDLSLAEYQDFQIPSLGKPKDKDKEYKENNFKNRYLDKEKSNFVNLSLNDIASDTPSESLNVERVEESNAPHPQLTSSTREKFCNSKQPFGLKITQSKFISSNKSKESNELGLTMEYFIPIADEDIKLLTQKVGRDFGKTFINALAQKLDAKYPDRRFINKQVFLSYMEKALTHEMHSPESVNNTNFAYSCMEESYLERIEAANDTSDVGLIKRRIAQEFDPKLATNILKKCYFRPVYKGCYNYTVYINDETFDLDEITRKRIENIIIEVTRRMDLATTETIGVEEVCFIQGKNYSQHTQNKENYSKSKLESPIDMDSNIDPIWARVRGKLREIYGTGADKSWFSKIKYSLYEGEGRVVLTFASEFRSEYIENNYGGRLNRILLSELPDIQEIVYEVESSNYRNVVWRRDLVKAGEKQDQEITDLSTTIVALSNNNIFRYSTLHAAV